MGVEIIIIYEPHLSSILLLATTSSPWSISLMLLISIEVRAVHSLDMLTQG